MSLDLVHVDRGRTDLLGHDDAVARGARMVRRGIALEHWLVLDEHFLVGAETAGGDHDGLGVDRVGLAVLGGELDARNGAVLVRHDVGDAGVRADVELAVLGGLPEGADHFGTDGRTVVRTVGAVVLGAARAAHHVEVAAEGHEPGERVLGVRAERADEFGIVDVVTALHRVGDELFDRVGNAVALLLGRFSRVEAAFGAKRVAAHHRHLFEDDHLLARVMERHGRGKAGTARTDHDNVGRVVGGPDTAHGGRKRGNNQKFFHVHSPYN